MSNEIKKQINNELQEEFIESLIKNEISNISDLIEKILYKKTPMVVKEKIKQIDKLKIWLDSFRPLSFDVVAELKKYYDVKFTYNSNAIEGNTLTQSETEMVLEKGITIGGKTLSEHLEVIGHKEAIDYIEDLSKKGTEISEHEIRNIHHLILQGTDRENAGTYRTLDVRAAGTEHVYPAHFLVSELMKHFVNWTQSDEAKSLHPMAFATEVHYRFVSIHPFKDGNGRTARLLMNLALLRAGYPIAIISNELRPDYIESLVYAQDNQNDTQKLLDLVVDSCERSLVDHLRIVSTASSKGSKGEEFYREVQNYLK